MRAVTFQNYGGPDVLKLSEVPRPVPEADEVLVRVRATTVNRTDCGFRQANPAIVRLFSGLRRPRRTILGTEFAGEVAQIGGSVTEFSAGDAVFGVNADRFGAHAEYVCVPEAAPIALKPEGASFEEAAAVSDGFVLASTLLSWTGGAADQRILVYGASGSIGTATVQLAKHLGAHVTAVCNTGNVELVRSLGADAVIDYTREDFTRHGQTYNVVIDAVGKSSFRQCRRLLVPGGVYASTDGGYLWQVPLLALGTRATRPLGMRRVMLPLPRYTKQHVLDLRAMLEAGRYVAVIDRSYPLEEAVEATRFVESEQKAGNVVLTVG